MRLFRLPAVAALALLAACDLSTEPNVPAPIDPAVDTYATALGVNIASMTKTSTGLYYKNLTLGAGAAAKMGDSVRVHYTLWLTNGTKVESSKDAAPPDPIKILLGDTSDRRVIPGFEEGIIGMLPGGIRQLVIPPHLAWGSRGLAPVQPNANVVFEIEYVERIPPAP
jgi:FKBP-type peptidyl-prolyl cis-trans isomerase FkpA